ncbi:MAG: hypothetical protein Q4G58_16320 [bacterium]|nr:hypothetical protein [bacterium]
MRGKKNIVAIGVFMGCILFMGCNSIKVDYNKIKDVNSSSKLNEWSPITVGENGYYYAKRDDTAIYYWEKETGAPVKLCGKADCKHDTSDCNSYVGGLVPESVQYIKEQVFYLAENGDRGSKKMSLFEMDKDGENHEKIMDLYDIPEKNSSEPMSLIHRGYLYYALNEIDADSDQENSKVYKVKIEKNAKPELIYDGKGKLLCNFCAKDDWLYFSTLNTNGDMDFKGEVLGIHTDTNNNRTMYSYDGKEYVVSFVVTDDALLCSIMNKGIVKINLNDLATSSLYNKTEKYEDGLSLFYDGTYIYEDNSIQCQVEESYDHRRVFVRDQQGKLVDTIMLKGFSSMIFGGDSKFMFLDDIGKVTFYDKSQIGTGKNELITLDTMEKKQ